MTGIDAILKTEALTKEFKGFTAVDSVDLTIERHAIHAMIGPNGAGKTTVFNLLTHFLPVSSGRILFNGREITGMKPAHISRRGIVRSFQISAVFPHMTALENVRVALQRRAGIVYQFWRSEKSLKMFDDQAEELLAKVGLQDFADTEVAGMPYGRKRALEIATTLALEPELLLLDEPTQGMGREDIERTTALIRDIAPGRTILMVEHNLGVVAELCDRITVLQRGSILTEGAYDDVAADPRVKEAYMGNAA